MQHFDPIQQDPSTPRNDSADEANLLKQWLEEADYPERGLRRLAGAMLITAIEDLTGRDRHRRLEVLRWIGRQDPGVFSFESCCALLGRDATAIRERLAASRFSPRSELGMRIVANRAPGPYHAEA